MADQVGNESRRATLQHIAESYSSVAQGLEGIASSDASNGMGPPLCSGCGNIMKWSRSQLVKDGPTMRHVFLCAACGSAIETEGKATMSLEINGAKSHPIQNNDFTLRRADEVEQSSVTHSGQGTRYSLK